MTKAVNVDRIVGFRYPSPGSQQVGARVPIRDKPDDVYDIKQFTRDPRNLPIDVRLFFPPLLSFSRITAQMMCSYRLQTPAPSPNLPLV